MSRPGRWAGALSLLALSLLLTEGLLHLLAWRVPAVDRALTPVWAVSPQTSDSVLGTRGNPRWVEHDARGFRNPVALDRADLVTLGDSHTYGVGVGVADPWPAILSARTGRVVYNMAFPGWGPGEAYLLLDSALARRPAVVVFGLYFGNDFFDAFIRGTRVPDIRGFLPPALGDTAARLESAAPLAASVHFLAAGGDTAPAPPPNRRFSPRRWLSRHSMLYAVLRAIRSRAAGDDGTPDLLARDLDRALARATDAERRFFSTYRGPEWRTLLTAPYRNRVLDDRDPRIRFGLEATAGLLVRMDRVCRDRGSRFLVVLLPTKERVFAPRVTELSAHPGLDSLLENESRLSGEIVRALDRAGVAHVDLLEPLRQGSQQPYFEDVDGHPNPEGHRRIAEAVAQWLRRAEATARPGQSSRPGPR